MIKLIPFLFIVSLTVFSPIGVFAEDDHDHSGHEHEEKNSKKTNNHDDHGDNDEHGQEHDDKKKKSDDDSHSHDNDSHSDEGNKSKAILEIEDDGNRFKLSSLSIKSIKLKYKQCEKIGKSKIKIPKEALVSFGNEYGVFVHKADWFELVEVSVESKSADSRIVSASYFSNTKTPCEIVVSGVPLLRVAQLEASGEGGEGHAH